ncbi:EamA family transporter RarD [Arenibaculum pallidiluteum]|uniref:EamA family transporter RarD n=1 Tax=Arenibaculum pallidiluteum TaxID=2812559 RepID=UPI001A95AA53|nr:EamA family transporter RarD [Arenibaculum pallidiluteum]
MTAPPADASRPDRSPDPAAAGLLYALTAFLCWGFVPIYFKALSPASPLEIVCHRTVWSVLFMAVVALALRRQGLVLRELRSPRRLAVYAVTAALISSNWLIYIWAIGQNMLVEASLGYYINPLVNVVLGVLFLGERLNRRQVSAVLLALAAVAVLVAGVGHMPWVALALAGSFGFYALVRKKAAVDPVGGLLVETAMASPFALGWLLWIGSQGQGAFGTHGLGLDLMLAGAGAVTALPLVLFNLGALRLRLSTIGLLQYLSPTIQLGLGTLAYGEPFTPTHAAAFLLIWAGLAVYSSDAVLGRRAARRTLPAE